MDAEIKQNAGDFRQSLPNAVAANMALVGAREAERLDDAYARLTSLQAWRSFVLDTSLPAGALGFYSEAQNDALTSSVLISAGLWRSSMKSLRGVIENSIQCMYYKDHPVEYRLWVNGKYRPTFRDLFAYLESHPDIVSLPESLNPLGEIKGHYSQLSNFVHASGEQFRMTNEVGVPLLWKTGVADFGKWAHSQKKVITQVNLLLLCLFSEKLQGAQNVGLKEALGICVPATKDALIKATFGFKIPR